MALQKAILKKQKQTKKKEGVMPYHGTWKKEKR